MGRIFKKYGQIFGLTLILTLSPFGEREAEAKPVREFVMACTYGVLAGTLVGAATLAFTDQPGDNLNNVARGASLGLYAGILLGAYVVYIVPSQLQQEQILQEPGYPPLPPGEVPEDLGQRFQLIPVFDRERGLEGVKAQLELAKF